MKLTPAPHRPHGVRAAVSAILSLAASGAHAGPQNGVVTDGSATISNPAADLTQVDQTTRGVSIDWDSFDIDAHERVNFSQPTADSVALNRIRNQDPSLILGSITANGRVFLLNPNGIIFGDSARVNVGSLVASSLDVSEADADSGRYTLSSGEAQGGAIVNSGLLTSADGGSITLLGGSVLNSGLIVADYGTVNLGAGRAATLHFDGNGLVRFRIDTSLDGSGSAAAVANSGEISAAGGQVLLTAHQARDVLAQAVNNTGVIRAARIDDTGGVIRLVGVDGAVANSGTLDASAADAASTGGEVHVLGRSVELEGTSRIDVSGSTGGGTALIGGGFGGADPSVANAETTRVHAGAGIRADSTASGDAGRVSVWADGTTRFSGTILARAEGTDGDGGFAEVSGGEHLAIDGHARLTSRNGRSGTLLLDPGSVTIEHDEDGADPSPLDDVFTDGWINEQLEDSSLQILTADSDNDLDEDLAVEGDVAISWTTAHTLTLSGGDSITLQAGSSIDGAGGLILQSGGAVVMNGALVLGSLEVTAGEGITQGAGAFEVTGNASFTAGEGESIALGHADNRFDGDVTFASGGPGDLADVTVADSTGLELHALSLTGNLTVAAGGPITQTGALDVAGTASFLTLDDAGAAITLGDANNFGTVLASARDADDSTNAEGAITINESGATTLGTVGTASTLAVTSGGTISQTGVVTVDANATFIAGNGGSIQLGNAGNAFGGTVGLASSGTLQDVTIADSTALDLQTLALAGNLAVVAGGAITQSGTLSVNGTASLRTRNNAGAAITLGGANNFGSVAASARNADDTANAAGAITINEAGATALGPVGTTATLAVTSGGSISQSGAVTAGANATFTAGPGGSILLGNTANNFGAAVALASSGMLQSVDIADSTAFDLHALTLAGNLTVDAASITQSGALAVAGTSGFTADAGQSIALALDNSFNGAVSFAASGGGGLQNVSVADLSALALQLPSLTGDLTVIAGGPITQVGALNVAGTANFRTRNNAGAAITLGGANNFGTVHAAARNVADTANTAGAITINEAGATSLGSIATTSGLAVTSGGTISQSGAVTVDGNSTFTAGAGGSILLGNAANAFGGTVGLASSGALQDVTLADSSALDLQATALTGNLAVDAASITQSGALSVGGTSSFIADAGQSITLTQDNGFNGAVSLAAAGGGSLQHVSVTDLSALALQLPSLTGNLAVTAGGPITQVGALDVAGTASFRTRNNAGAAITLTGTNNFGTVQAAARNLADSANAAGAITIHEAGATTLGTIGTTSTLTLVSGGSITQSGGATAGGNASFTAGAGGSILLGNGLNSFGGAVGLASSGVLQDVTLVDATALDLQAMTLAGNLIVDAASITQSGALSVVGTSSFTADAGQSIALDEDNSFNGAVAFAASGGGSLQDVSVTDLSALALQLPSLTGNLAVIAGGPITQAGALNVSGNAGFSTRNNAGAAITLTGANNFGTVQAAARNAADNANAAGAISIHEAGGTTLGPVGTGASLVVSSGGSIGQSGALNVGGSSTFTAGNGGSILLGNAGNTLGGAVTLASTGTLQDVTIADSTALDLHALDLAGNLDARAASITQSGGLDVEGTSRFTLADGQSLELLHAGNVFSGAVTLAAISGSLMDAGIYGHAGLQLAGATLAGDLSLATDGSITQSGALSVAGDSTFTAGGGQSVLLDHAGNSFGGTVQFAAASGALRDVSIADTSALDLRALGIDGDLEVRAVSITQSGALGVGGAASFTAAGGQSIALGLAGNDFAGAVSLASSGGGSLQDVTLADSSAIDLGPMTLAGDLSVTAGGAITQSGALDVAGAAHLRTRNDAGAAITLAGTNDFGTLHAAVRNAVDSANATATIVVNQTGALVLGDIDTAGAASVSAGGAITRLAGADVDAASLSLAAGGDIGGNGSPIMLATPGITLAASTPGSLYVQGAGDLRLASIGAGATAAISSGGSILDSASASVISADALALQAAGAIGEAAGSGNGALELQAQSVAATATGGGINLEATAGDLNLRQIQAAGPVRLRAVAGSIADDPSDGAAASISSTSGGVHLRAQGNIGTVTDLPTRQGTALRVDTHGGTLGAQVDSATGQVNLLFAAGDAPTVGAGAISAGGDGRLLLQSPGDLSLGGLAGAIIGFSQVGFSADAVLSLSSGIIAGAPDVVMLRGGTDIASPGRVLGLDAGHLVFDSGGQGGAITLNTAVDRLDATMGGGAGLTVSNSTALTVGSVGAAGDLSIRAADIQDDGDADGVTRVSAGGTLSLSSATGIGRADGGAGGRIDTSGATLVLQTDAGSAFVSNTGNLQVRGAVTGGSLDVVAPTGSITVNGALGATGTLALTAGSTGTAGNILLNATAQAAQAHLTALGGGSISDADASVRLVATDARLQADSIGAAGNALGANIGSLEATAGSAIRIDATGEMQIRAIAAPTVVIGSTGSLLDDGNAATRVSGQNVTLAGAAIGTPGSAVGTAAGTITLSATGGGIHVNELDALAVGSVTAAGAGNDIVITAGGAIGDDGVAATRITGGQLTLAGTSLGAEGSALRTQVGGLTATTAGGLHIEEADGLQLNAISAADIRISAGGALTDDGSDATRLSATSVSLVAQSAGAADSRIDTAADTLAIDVGAGGAFVDELDAVELASVNTPGAFDLRANGAITDTAGASVTAATAVLHATSIGAADNPLDTVVGTLTATATAGGVTISNAGNLAIIGVSASGPVDVRTTAALTQSGAITSGGAAIDITAGSIAMGAAATTHSGGGNLTYVAQTGDATLGVLDAGNGRTLVIARRGVYSALNPDSGLHNVAGALIEVRAGGLGGAGQIGTVENPLGIDAAGMAPRTVFLIVPAQDGIQVTTPQLSGTSSALLMKGYSGSSGALLFDLSSTFTPEAVVQGGESIIELLNGRAAVNTDSLSAASQALSSGVVTRVNIDWSAFDPEVSLFSTVGPSVRLPEDQNDEAVGP